MSKITELRRQATDAVRSRRWDKAVQLYERVCDLDSGNASYRNELGDIYLKMGDVTQAVGAFVTAAELYRNVGLTNNAVAVHKKILRHDPNHLDSLWGLGDIRFEQGLETEAVSNYLDFLARSEAAPVNDRPRILERCDHLIDNLGGDPQVLSKLESLFEHWETPDLQARVLVAKAALAQEAGESDMADKYVERARTILPELDALPDYRRYVESHQGSMPMGAPPAESEIAAPSGNAEPGLIDLSDEPSDVIEIPTDEENVLDLSDEDLDLGFDFSGGGGGTDDASEPEDVSATPDPEPAAPAGDELDELEVGPGEAIVLHDETDFSDLSTPESEEEGPEPDDLSGPVAVEEPDEVAEEAVAAPSAEPPPEEPDAPQGSDEADGAVDLLSELLAEGGLDLGNEEKAQIDTIAQEMEGQLGGDVAEDDHAGQYDLGIVYMDMGLFDQAIAAFERASMGEEQRLKAIEMKGACHLRAGRSEQAMSTFQDGLAVAGYPARYYLGLLYGVGACHEEEGNLHEAIDYFERVAQVDENFQDVATRLASLHQLAPDEI